MPLHTPLDRPDRPALPNSFFWTWDHSTNWMLDDPGNQIGGSHNDYLKKPETFIEDYRRLTDFSDAIGVRHIAIFGFLRDSHGGVDYAKRIASYGASRNVAIMPGIGVTTDGGPVFEGEHRYNLDVFLRKCPEARSLRPDGTPMNNAACPLHPQYRQWLDEGLHWLFDAFDIAGMNMEVVDLAVDHHPLTLEARKAWPAADPEPYFFQGMGYQAALEALGDRVDRYPIAYASYTGFTPTDKFDDAYHMGPVPPAMLKVLPPKALCQWTLSTMLRETPVPLTDYLDNGAPAEALDQPNWPAGLTPPSPRGIGFMHQGSQWHAWTRHDCIVSTIKEACLRAWRCGLEGVGMHGEVSYEHVPAALNYLAFSHFIHWPEDSLLDFGRKTLAQVLGSEKLGEQYAIILAHEDADRVTDDDRAILAEHAGGPFMAFRGNLEQYQHRKFWRWLYWQCEKRIEPHTISFHV